MATNGRRSVGQTVALAAGLASLLLAPGEAPAASGFAETVLPNGLRVVMRQVRGNPVVCSAVLVKSGVAWEPEGMSGASHFLEHLLFNGTRNRTQEQLYADVERIGAYNNATTRADHTLFLMLAPSESLDRALEIQADMLFHSTLPEDKFDKEKGIVLEEMRRDASNPAHEADLAFTRALHAGSPYARPVLGTAESIAALARDAVLDYYHRRYRPGNMVLFLAGEFEPDEALARIRERFGVPGGAGEAESGVPRPTLALTDPARIVHEKIEAGRTYLRAAFPAPDAGDPDAEAFDLLVRLAGSGEGSPLVRNLVRSDPAAAFDAALSYSTVGGRGVLELDATLTGRVPAAEVIRRARRALAEAAAPGLLDLESLRALRESRLTTRATLDEQVHYYAMFSAPALLHASAADLEASAARLAAVTPEEIAAVARRYLGRREALAVVSGPGEEPGTVEEFAVPAPEWPAPPEAGPRTLVLPNGLTVSIRPNPDSAVFAVHLLARNRSALEPPGRPGLAELLHGLLRAGTASLDALELDRALDLAGAQLKLRDDPRIPFDDYQSSPDFSFVRLESRAERAPEALRLLAELIQQPLFPAEDVTREAERMADRARRAAESPSAVSRRILLELLAPGHPLSRPVAGEPGSFDGLTRNEVVALHSSLFAPDNLILAVRGGVDPSEIERRIARLFGGRGTGGARAPAPAAEPARPTALVPPPAPTAAGSRREVTLGKRQSSLRVGTIVDVPEKDLPALEVAVLVLSGRLQMDLRETQGLAYSIGAGLTPLGAGRRLLQIAMGTAATNLEHAEKEIFRILRELREEPPPVEELERVVAARRGRIFMRRLTSINQAYYDALGLLYGEPTGGDPELLEAIRRVTPEQVLRAARAYIDPDRFAVAVVR
ncbi:MAG: insulinase family protein [Acidobacteria bacterium]|nr:MAG: insulinase family protein [Acidobacteriota bacterium]